MSDRIAVMAHGRDRAARRAARDLRPPRDRVRRRLHRRHELPRGHRHGGRQRPLDGARSTARASIRGRGSAPLGVPLRIGLRPEKLLVTAAAAGDRANTLHCTLATRMELGDQVQLVAELPGGRQLVAREQRALAASAEHLNSGDPVVVSFDDDAPILLPARRARNRHPHRGDRSMTPFRRRDPHAGPAQPNVRRLDGLAVAAKRTYGDRYTPGRAARARGPRRAGARLPRHRVAAAAGREDRERPRDLQLVAVRRPVDLQELQEGASRPQDHRDVLLVERRADRQAHSARRRRLRHRRAEPERGRRS